MKLFEMSNSYTQKTRSMWFFYIGIALLLKSWIVLSICFFIWKTCSILEFCTTCSWGQFSATSPRILSSAFPGKIIWVVGVCWFLHFIDYFCCLVFLSMFINRVIFHLLFLLLSWRPFGLFLFITLVSLWLALIVRCRVRFSRNDHFLWTWPDIRICFLV